MKEIVRRSGPHIESRDSVRRNMWEVSAALLPAVAAATIFFGPYSLYLVFASAIAAAIMERPFTPGGFTIGHPLGDGSAFLAGMLFGLTLAPGTPWWIPLFGAAVVVFVGKQAFGGIGHNVFNPALVARGILLIAYPALVTEWRVPLNYDVVTAAIGGGSDDPYQIRRIAEMLTRIIAASDWRETLNAHARCKRIVRDLKETYPLSSDADPEAASKALHAAYQTARQTLDSASDPLSVFEQTLIDLRDPINHFFDSVLVMAEEPSLKIARLSLVQHIANLPNGLIDMSQLEGF